MGVAEPLVSSWKASLSLDFSFENKKTTLSRNVHDGPLIVQKPLYPEGREVCHAIVVHPPGGIAGGDELSLKVQTDKNASALLTTPGAAKWYRSSGAWARQGAVFDVEGALEWLPQETIVFEGARADIAFEASLEADARLVAWEIVCLGRTGSGERFETGECRLHTRVVRDGRLVWRERGRIEPASRAAASAAGLAGEPVFATMIVAAPEIDDACLAAARAVSPERGTWGVSRLPGLLVARHRGDSTEVARRYCTAVWAACRVGVLGREAVEPRIWRT
jgi:urease accessory protein